MNYRLTHDCHLVQHLLSSQLLGPGALNVLDIGCAGGLHWMWRMLGEAGELYGIDSQVREIERLREEDTRSNTHYLNYHVGLPDDHPFKQQLMREQKQYAGTYWDPQEPWRRSSAHSVNALLTRDERVNEYDDRITPDTITIDELTASLRMPAVDFLKIDCDGGDLEALVSAESTLRDTNVLGIAIETNLTGGAHETSNSLHNIDRYLKRFGYQPFDLRLARFGRSALPRVFDGYPAQTRSGPLMHGDAFFFLDIGASDFERATGRDITREQILKCCVLFELFDMMDCAAEVIQKYASTLRAVCDGTQLLDLLAHDLGADSYAAHCDAFRRAPKSFVNEHR